MIKQLVNSLIYLSFGFILLASSVQAKTLDEAQFQDHVLTYLKDKYPQFLFEKNGRKDIITLGENQLGLFLVYQPYSEGKYDDKSLQAALDAHFSPIMAGLDANQTALNYPWEQAKTALFPLLVAKSSLSRNDLIHHALDDHIVATFVVRTKQGNKFVTRSQMRAWKVDLDAMTEVAESNLASASANMPMNIATEGNKFIVVQARDGFDASRILVSQIREFFIQHLGEPFYAALPHRDILVVWSGDNEEKFKAAVKTNIKNDYQNSANKLSPNRFEIKMGSIKPLKP